MMNRYFYNKETQDLYEVEINTRKELLALLDDVSSWLVTLNTYDDNEDAFGILYKDGSFDWIDEEYDGHKIRKINIASIVWNNSENDVVFGNFEINECGIVTASEEMKISEELIEVDEAFAKEFYNNFNKDEETQEIVETIEETVTVKEIVVMIENNEVELIATHKTENGQEIFTVKQGNRKLAYCYKLDETSWKICFALVVKKRRGSKELLQ